MRSIASEQGTCVFGRLPNLALVMLILLLPGCGKEPLNNPYPGLNGSENVLYSAFTQKPKHFDPAISYSEDEALFNYQIYEPPLQYHYLKRPYEVVPLVTQGMPIIKQENGFTIYQIKIKPGVYYQPHPAFALKPNTNTYLYHQLSDSQLDHIHSLNDFAHTGTRELTAEDFIYEIKRLADPTINSPVAGILENYIDDFKALSQNLKTAYEQAPVTNGVKWIDLRKFDFGGAKAIDKYTYEIKIKGQYPQFLYWLTMPFFAPVPWEAAQFYAQAGLIKNNITLDWYPVGTGPYYLVENNPNLRMVLAKNPNFHGETYPLDGMPGDKEKGYLANAGKPLPFIDKIVFVLEREGIPYWNKFLQGYYDSAGVTNNNFDQAIKITSGTDVALSDSLKAKGIRLATEVSPSLFYWGVNMLDDTIGGYSDKKSKLRKAISLAIDMEEYIKIFLNGRAVIAQSPIPEGIFGSIDDKPIKTDPKEALKEAKKLLSEAGYPNGIDPKTKAPLNLYLDIPVSSGPDSQSQLNWQRKQFEKLGIELIIRGTQYSRFQDKMSTGDFQLFIWGWNADYPDPENFLFLLHGPNSRIKNHGENASNYANSEFDELYDHMKILPNSPERLAIIQKMLAIVKNDNPWLTGYNPISYTLRQAWVNPSKANPMARNTLKYMSINPQLRANSRAQWNQPTIWPLWFGLLGFILLCIPGAIIYYRRMYVLPILKPCIPLEEVKN